MSASLNPFSELTDDEERERILRSVIFKMQADETLEGSGSKEAEVIEIVKLQIIPLIPFFVL